MMIQIERLPCPTVLKNAPMEGRYYNRKEVVVTLHKMQHGKCCYCEQYIPEKGHLKAVEHFHPKSIFKDLKNDWKNLLLACGQCNGKKSDKFPIELTTECDKPKVIYCKNEIMGDERPCIINPSDPNIDPEEHIEFIVDISKKDWGNIRERNGSLIGRETITTVGLDGSYYFRKRRDHLLKLLSHFELFLITEKQKGDLSTHKEKFENLSSPKEEFTAITRDFIRTNNLHGRLEIKIKIFDKMTTPNSPSSAPTK